MSQAAAIQHEPVREYLTPTEVAHLLRVSPNTVARWARDGKLPCQRTLGGHRRFDRDAVMTLWQRLHSSSGEI